MGVPKLEPNKKNDSSETRSITQQKELASSIVYRKKEPMVCMNCTAHIIFIA